jgi:hypothetical protein
VNAFVDFRPGAAEFGVGGKQSAFLHELVDQRIGGLDVIGCDVEPDFVQILLGKDGLSDAGHVPLPWLLFSKTRAAAPLDLVGIECAGVTAGDAGLNIFSQLIELHLVEAVFFFHQAQCLAHDFTF